MINLAQTIDELGEAQARQARLHEQLLGIEEETREAARAHLRLQYALELRWREVAAEWRQAKADAQAAVFFLDRAVTS